MTFDRVAKALARWIEAAIGIALAVMVVLVFGNVVLRYGFNSGITISEEVSRYLFVWLTFIGAVVGVYERVHLGVDSLLRALPRRWRLGCVVVSEVLMLLASAILFYGCWKQTLVNLGTRSPVSGIPLSILYVAGLLASFMMAIIFTRNLYKLLFLGASDEDLTLTVESEDLASVERTTHALQAAGGMAPPSVAPRGNERR